MQTFVHKYTLYLYYVLIMFLHCSPVLYNISVHYCSISVQYCSIFVYLCVNILIYNYVYTHVYTYTLCDVRIFRILNYKFNYLI